MIKELINYLQNINPQKYNGIPIKNNNFTTISDNVLQSNVKLFSNISPIPSLTRLRLNLNLIFGDLVLYHDIELN